MSQSVDRLKELLFDSETRTLSEMTRRLDTVFERAGSEERFTSSVAGVLDGALRKAEVDRHAELADAIAPLVVRTVKTEIRNSQDELVEALYPMTGRMVKAYVASAMKDLANDINRRLEANPVMLRIRSLTSGKSVAELAMAEAQQLKIEELYLVRRGTGELIGRWPEASETEGRDHVMSGILTAINEFSSEALKDEGSNLRQIDIGERQLYLRASQSYLLAAKCSGVAPSDVEAILDEAFLATLEGIQHDRETYGSLEAAAARRGALLSEVSRGLDERITEKHAALAAGISPLSLVAWIVGVPVAAWLAWGFYADYRTERARTIASAAITETEGIKGYPVRITVERLGYAITIGGLAPSLAAKEEAVANLRRALPGTEVRDQLTVLPSGLAEIEPQIENVRRQVAGLEAEVEPEVESVKRDLAGLRSEVTPGIERVNRELQGLKAEVEPEVERVKSDLAGLKAAVTPELERVKAGIAAIEAQSKRLAVVKAMERANRRLGEVGSDLARLQSSAAEDSRSIVGRASQEVQRASKDLQTYKARSAGQGLEGLAELAPAINAQSLRLKQVGAELSGLIAKGMTEAFTPSAGHALPTDIGESAEELAAETERLATLTVAVSQALALKSSLPRPQPAAAPQPTPRERVEAWTRANAVFFGSGTEFRDTASAEKAMDELASLMRAGDVLVRVVGYTDDQGGQDRNLPLSQARAQKVVGGLVARNVPADRLVSVGRVGGYDLSTRTGDASPNRRVEFEVGFVGEEAP